MKLTDAQWRSADNLLKRAGWAHTLTLKKGVALSGYGLMYQRGKETFWLNEDTILSHELTRRVLGHWQRCSECLGWGQEWWSPTKTENGFWARCRKCHGKGAVRVL